jgi:hypothetical protein
LIVRAQSALALIWRESDVKLFLQKCADHRFWDRYAAVQAA